MEKYFMNREINLTDGSFGRIFSKVNSSDNSGDILFNCHLCRVGRLPGENNLRVHIKGKRHVKNLQTTPNAVDFRKPLEVKDNSQLKVSASKEKEKPGSSKAASMANQVSSAFDVKQLVKQVMTNANEVYSKAYHMEKYKQYVKSATKSIVRDYEKYRRTPEDHPMYKDEWIEFWGRRYKELKKEGRLNPNDYDYKPEWIAFWTKRMEEIFDESIEAKKKEIQSKLNLPANFEVNERKLPPKKRPRSPPEYESVSSDDSYYPSYRRRRSNSFSSPQQLSSRRYYDEDKPTYKASSIDYRSSLDEYMNEPVSLINVCRLLSALEAELGSLSQKVLDLLSKALAIEKMQPNTCDQALMTTENAILLEIVKEKMKGLLMIDVLPRNKVAAVKKCIQNIARLIHQTPIKVEEKKTLTLVKNSAESGRNADDEGKMKIAKEIADALKAQGKEDCTAEELEILVETFLECLNEQSEVSEEQTSGENKKDPSSFESLTDDDLKILLGNFSDLKADEQDSLIDFLSYIEKTNPARVAELRQFVNVNSAKKTNINEVIEIDNDPDDYNIDEVITSVVQHQLPPGVDLTDDLLSLNNSRSFYTSHH